MKNAKLLLGLYMLVAFVCLLLLPNRASAQIKAPYVYGKLELMIELKNGQWRKFINPKATLLVKDSLFWVYSPFSEMKDRFGFSTEKELKDLFLADGDKAHLEILNYEMNFQKRLIADGNTVLSVTMDLGAYKLPIQIPITARNAQKGLVDVSFFGSLGRFVKFMEPNVKNKITGNYRLEITGY